MKSHTFKKGSIFGLCPFLSHHTNSKAERRWKQVLSNSFLKFWMPKTRTVFPEPPPLIAKPSTMTKHSQPCWMTLLNQPKNATSQGHYRAVRSGGMSKVSEDTSKELFFFFCLAHGYPCVSLLKVRDSKPLPVIFSMNCIILQMPCL